jgi:hypothetical protein
MISRNQLAIDILYIINSYYRNKDIRKLHKRSIKFDKYISLYIHGMMYDEYKCDMTKIYNNNIINGEDDETFINDFINNLDNITYQLLIFE